jgi:hypothetical protein
VAIAFKELRNVEEHLSQDIALADHGKATKNLIAAVQVLNNSEDLSNLLEVYDVVDELHILMKLSNQQIFVIDKMIQRYERVDEQNGDKDAHARARGWLRRAGSKVRRYNDKCKELLEDCDKTIEKVSRTLHST